MLKRKKDCKTLMKRYLVIDFVGKCDFSFIATYENAVGDNFTDGNSYLQVWIAYCDYLNREARKDDTGILCRIINAHDVYKS